MHKLTPIILFLIAACSSTASKEPAVPNPSPEFVIDVRTAAEYAGGHIPGAFNIPYDVIGAKIAGITADTSASIVVYCRTGRRSGIAMETLTQMGYGHVENAGGYEEYSKRVTSDE